MTDKNKLKEFEEMFNLPSQEAEDDDNEQAEEYGHSADSTVPYDELVKDVAGEVKSMEEHGAGLEVETRVRFIRSTSRSIGYS